MKRLLLAPASAACGGTEPELGGGEPSAPPGNSIDVAALIGVVGPAYSWAIVPGPNVIVGTGWVFPAGDLPHDPC